MTHRHATILIALLSAAGWMGGCRGGATITDSGVTYPEGTRTRRPVDIQAFREGTRLTLTNTTAQAFGPSTLWANMRFGMAIDGLAVGQTLDLDLRDFKDQYGSAFRAGGFFASERPQRLVMLEIETHGEGAGLYSCTVMKGEGE
ncbi:MAG: hypothetical protein HBSAPP03_10390 [Phycisphaerae bacterium]|nr:MAG: hypothetical protein HBSAPP03_10390 [Phycisphaerae bacterium]